MIHRELAEGGHVEPGIHVGRTSARDIAHLLFAREWEARSVDGDALISEDKEEVDQEAERMRRNEQLDGVYMRWTTDWMRVKQATTPPEEEDQ